MKTADASIDTRGTHSYAVYISVSTGLSRWFFTISWPIVCALGCKLKNPLPDFLTR